MSIFAKRILEGQVALITGGGSGIGAGIARRFAEHGASVALVGRKLEKLERTAAALTSLGSEVLCLPLDVRDYAALEAAVQQLVTRFGRLDVLVNSAAGNFLSPAASLSANGFKSVIEIDLIGTFNASRACFEALAVRGGSIVSITATQAWIPTPLQCHAGAAKAGIAKLTADLALEWGASRIRVNAVAPGPIADTEGMRRLGPDDDVAKKRLESGLPLGRWGTVDEVADAVLYLSSPAAGFITGTTLTIDGGQSLLGAGSWLAMMQG
ncbi:MAG: SDR family oxidoreductase [Myxococcales bacterium]|nr:SDR family oxidoreductase [Myxococcales bacterium]